MSDPKRLEMMAEIARLYYEKNLNIKEIGKTFGVSPSSVSRLLKEAQERKIVEVKIRYPFLTVPSLGKQLQQHLKLKEVYVLPDFKGSYSELMERLGMLAARVLEERLEDGMTLGVSLGVAVANTAKSFTMTRDIHCRVVRLHGANDNELVEGANLAQKFSAQLGNQFKIIPSPFIMQNRHSCELIVREPSVQEAIRDAESCNIALIGLGSMNYSVSTLLRNRLISPEELEELSAAGAVGEICGKHYDFKGKVLDAEFNHRTVSIDLQKLQKIKTVIGVAGSPAKTDAILGAVRGHLINTLVTDTTAANILLEKTL
jgi:deoxyribonucleoside regulator